MSSLDSNQNKDMRDAFFDEIYLESINNPNLIVITNDMDIFSLRKLKEQICNLVGSQEHFLILMY